MSQFVEVKTSELVGKALDWAVGQTEEFKVVVAKLSGSAWVRIEEQPRYGHHYKPSTDWAQGGPLIDKYRPDLQTTSSSELVVYLNNDVSDPGPLIDGRGETYLVAICRAIVTAKLGDVVQVPVELAGVA